jgi:DNA-binding GntR family transcriptional regulator
MGATEQRSRVLTTGPTLADQAYRAIREEITTGRLEPAERVTERALADRLGVSPTPVREALRRLEHERLVVRSDTRTITIASPSLDHLRDFSMIEAALRGVAARLAAERATERERAAIKAKFAEFDALPKRYSDDAKVRDRALRLTRDLHRMIDQAAHSETLIDMIDTATAFDFTFRTRFAEQLYAKGTTIKDRHEQHRGIVEAVVDGDADKAETLMRDHIQAATKTFASVAEAASRDDA